jgi:glycosyltransferase involved in cell wall biosynthesis
MISIITPSFRQLDHLVRCAASVDAQKADVTLEHIIQDGGTGPEFDEWAAKQSFAKCFQEPDEGMYDAINQGFTKSSGEILAWLNCDEQYLPGTLAKVEKYFAQHPETDILFGDTIVCDSDLRPVCYRHSLRPWRKHIRRCFLPNYSAATFVRRRVIEDGFLLNTGFLAIADAVWMHELLGSGYRTAVMPEPLSLFVLTGENLGHTPASVQEAREWGQRDLLYARIEAWLLSTVYHIRKFLAGAYAKRQVDITYFLGNPAVERRFSGLLGGKWPRKKT